MRVLFDECVPRQLRWIARSSSVDPFTRPAPRGGHHAVCPTDTVRGLPSRALGHSSRTGRLTGLGHSPGCCRYSSQRPSELRCRAGGLLRGPRDLSSFLRLPTPVTVRSRSSIGSPVSSARCSLAKHRGRSAPGKRASHNAVVRKPLCASDGASCTGGGLTSARLIYVVAGAPQATPPALVR